MTQKLTYNKLMKTSLNSNRKDLVILVIKNKEKEEKYFNINYIFNSLFNPPSYFPIIFFIIQIYIYIY
jgi:hypothetical protein